MLVYGDDYLPSVNTKIMEYKLISGEEFEVSSKVTELLEDGWRLHGSPSMAMVPGFPPSFVQALIKGPL